LYNIQREKILPYIKNDAWFKEGVLERSLNELDELRDKMDQFDDLRLGVIEEFSGLLLVHPQILTNRNKSQRALEIKETARRVHNLRRKLLSFYNSFVRNSYRKYLPSEAGPGAEKQEFEDIRQDLINRFNSIIEPDVHKSLDMMSKFLSRLNKEKFQ